MSYRIEVSTLTAPELPPVVFNYQSRGVAVGWSKALARAGFTVALKVEKGVSPNDLQGE